MNNGLCIYQSKYTAGRRFLLFHRVLNIQSTFYVKSSGDSKGGRVGHGSSRFLVGPFFGATSFFLNFPYKFVWLTYKLQ